MIRTLLTASCFRKAIESIYLAPAKTNDIFTKPRPWENRVSVPGKIRSG
mgnify:CR=1 FL=1